MDSCQGQKHGARVYPLDGEKILIKQTILLTRRSDHYVVMADRERHVRADDDAALAAAVRDALAGAL